MAKKNKRMAGMTRKTGEAGPVSSEFNPDYSQVKKDLVRIGTLAGSFFAILIILSFIIK
jgi:hypothetical protein